MRPGQALTRTPTVNPTRSLTLAWDLARDAGPAQGEALCRNTTGHGARLTRECGAVRGTGLTTLACDVPATQLWGRHGGTAVLGPCVWRRERCKPNPYYPPLA